MILAIVMVAGLIPGAAVPVFATGADCSQESPHQLSLPYTSETLELTRDDNWDHYYAWTAPEAGTLGVTLPIGLYCHIDINNDDVAVGEGDKTITADVAAGGVVLINVYSLSVVNGSWSASFTAGEATTPDDGETTTPTFTATINGEAAEDAASIYRGDELAVSSSDENTTFVWTGEKMVKPIPRWQRPQL